jgi:hypothetical protein
VRKRLGRRVACFVFSFLVLPAPCLAAAFKICVDVENCHNCDYYDAAGNNLYSIYWCSYN